MDVSHIRNLLLAMEHDLTIIPILNKIDMPAAQVEAVQRQVIDLMGGTPDDMLLVSAKQGIGVEEVLAAISPASPLWERVLAGVRGFNETLGTLTPALSQREREQRPLAQKTVKFMLTLHQLALPRSHSGRQWFSH